MKITLGLHLVAEVARLKQAVGLAIEHLVKTFREEVGPATLPEYWLALGRLDGARLLNGTAMQLCDALAAFREQTRGLQAFGQDAPRRTAALHELFSLGIDLLRCQSELRRVVLGN